MTKEHGATSQEMFVGINEVFQLFPSKNIHAKREISEDILFTYNTTSFHSRKLLLVRVNEGLAFPQRIHASPINYIARKRDFINPFNPELGYRITTEDYDSLKRSEKILELELWDERLDTSNAALRLSATQNLEDLEKYDIGKKIKIRRRNKIQIKEGLIPIVQRLRFQLFFPKGLSCEAEVDQEDLKFSGNISFYHFYPLDGGPLASPSFHSKVFYKKGLKIALPSNIEELQKIRGKFALIN